MLTNIIDRITKTIKIAKFRREWRKINSHNQTVVKDIFPLNIVTVGKKSYGLIYVKNFFHKKEKLQIGNFVSIANNVTFILGGNHQINTFTTFPLYSLLINASPERDANTKGSIIVKDEVWIGYGSTILSGITIGKGAIIAAESIVTKDVPSYAIVGGNPAKFIKFRFNKEVIAELIDLNITDFDEKVIIQNINEFYKPFDLKQVEKLKKIKQKYMNQ
ncbi:MAG: CatB-related O-acetyltransferase [Bacteroidota bacterium]|nr:CatB-related O-acetyltransferase [Bacteroidota bacterium]